MLSQTIWMHVMMCPHDDYMSMYEKQKDRPCEWDARDIFVQGS